jgi:molybdenum cofactor synthesis domain-containing protein
MRVAVVTVGDELLAGDTENTNATWLCSRLTERGVDVERVVTVPDRIEDIARVVNEARAEYDAVLVSGGIGPTHDDLTMAAVAAAVGVDLVENEAALEHIVEEGGYARQDLAEGTADIPAGARPLHNDVGVAPGCEIESIYVLPGVPAEMRGMFESVTEEFEGVQTHREMVLADEPESALLERIETLRKRYPVTVGSYPGDAVRVTVDGEDEADVLKAAAWLRERVESPEE